ncbi:MULTISPECIES: transcriptional regulator [Acinetobacter calcoaceticus/baumannii complex]|uniref:transcriptional regulator n=1 Tax=Acinetobacter calcoaceticus/baumannii complex TaxID=909768 RepID=UPI0015802845|nr:MULTISPECIES: transcriptional regulator [Acinetobacter calcoaceticus/baumannii complex]MDC5271860.1 helix-turn-helix domain-containing protein [Acinetobacter baumannii]MDC5617661.1 helix-turn-helix domain-containing protein [Acinetobacter baumannii]MDC5631675.1 helix-turn-helix domain-containing protein [Acinetobacter baumannii]NUF52547.1 transcriptional regulator [Acinetobacter seifertii]
MSESNDMHRMTPEQLRQAGELLYGNQWQSDLARALDVDARRVRDWLQERRPIPVGVKVEVIQLLKKNSLATANYAELLNDVEEQQK